MRAESTPAALVRSSCRCHVRAPRCVNSSSLPERHLQMHLKAGLAALPTLRSASRAIVQACKGATDAALESLQVRCVGQ